MMKFTRYLLGLVLLPAATGLNAQTAAQLQLLSNLSPEQRQALLARYGGTQAGATTRYQAAPDPVTPDHGRIPGAPEPLTDEPGVSHVPGSHDAPVEDELQPFGYNLFRGAPSTFAPVSDAPVPPEFLLGPGDNLSLRLFGKEAGEYPLVIDRTGQVFLPDVGPISLGGMNFAQAQKAIIERVQNAKLGVSASVNMGELRSIRIFVAGDARYPGSYTISALSTITQALYLSGGVDEIGSLRNVQLRRAGKQVATLDLYDLFMRGDSTGDQRLQAGDVVFIPPIGSTVAISGAVRRPAIYELVDEQRLRDVIPLAGGLLPGAVADRVTVARVSNGRKTYVSAGRDGAQSSLVLKSGDEIHIAELIDSNEGGVELVGPAKWPGVYAAGNKQRFTDVVRSPRDLLPFSDLDFALVLRRSADGATIEPIYVNPRRAFAGQADADVLLLPGDKLQVFSRKVDQLIRPRSTEDETALSKAQQRTAKELGLSDRELIDAGAQSQIGDAERGRDADPSPGQQRNADQEREGPSRVAERNQDLPAEALSRGERMAQIVASFRSVSGYQAIAPVIEVVGAVRFPGEIPLDPSRNTIRNVLRAAGGMPEAADVGFVEITRAPSLTSVSDKAERLIVRVPSESMDEVKLYPGDVLAVRSIPGADEKRTVSILGEVLYPGSYSVASGTTLREVVARAGGLTWEGYARGAVFTREDLRNKEEAQVERLRTRLRGDLAAAVLTKSSTSPQGNLGLNTLQGLFNELAQYQPLGRLVIDLEGQITGRGKPITLADGDVLIIPREPEEVTVVGEVQFPTSHRWEPGKKGKSYLKKSGGFTQLADDKRAFIVRADGSVEAARSGLFRSGPVLAPGDVIVVPLDATPIEPLTLFSSVTQVIYQLALTVAAFNSVGAF